MSSSLYSANPSVWRTHPFGTTGDDPELTIKGLPRPGEIRELIKHRTAAE